MAKHMNPLELAWPVAAALESGRMAARPRVEGAWWPPMPKQTHSETGVGGGGVGVGGGGVVVYKDIQVTHTHICIYIYTYI